MKSTYLGQPKPFPPSGSELPFLSSDDAWTKGTKVSVSPSWKLEQNILTYINVLFKTQTKANTCQIIKFKPFRAEVSTMPWRKASLAVDKGEQLSFMLWPLNLYKGTRSYPLERRLSGAQSRFGCSYKDKNTAHTRKQTFIVQTTPNHHTVWAILVLTDMVVSRCGSRQPIFP